MVQTGFGGPEVVRLHDLAEPVAGPTDAVVAVDAAALNRLDLLQRRGPGLLPGFALPHIAGMDLAGRVVAAGSAVTSLRVGDRVVVDPTTGCGRCAHCVSGNPGYCATVAVIGGNRPGGFAEYVAVPAALAHRVPDHIALADAAALPTAWAVAFNALHRVGQLRSGETVLIPAATSAVSMAAIQLARRAGARVVAIARTEAKRAAATDLGADVVLDLDDRTAAAVAAYTDGHGVDLVVDHVGAATWNLSLGMLRTEGRLVLLGNTSGDQVSLSLANVYHRGLRLLGAGAYTPADFAAMLDVFFAGGMRVVRAAEYPLTDLAEAYARQESGDLVGKILIRP
ncbi:zinc-binding dehydrogenase [Solwaraspora sp. WMMD791]|uniref:zinc-binding dehydrogenase n=1 Tax=Solwaraspora sp. WMMD791 TaxID=3016086 RepID=UPI00249C7634|nr:zinc-binding dehydrogenase [Solwaraspora sp. WMMD791]WFE29954.1 zinc-binding dehydrogenase [Solwaraspora sp. WMMD791]